MNSYYAPYEFMKKVEQMNPLFKLGYGGDSKDFIIFILEQLHIELKSAKKSIDDVLIDEPLNQYNKKSSFYAFTKYFQSELSIISDLFFGVNETTNICLLCQNWNNSKGKQEPICYNYGIFNVLIFPLEEVKKMEENGIIFKNMQTTQFPNKIDKIDKISIYDCFLWNQKSNLLCGENQNYCNICKKLYDTIYTSIIFTPPNIIIIILNRGKNNIYNHQIDIEETIDIAPFVLAKDKDKLIYNLYGVVTLLGESGPNGHFIASCKNHINNKWYRFDDALINEIKDIQKEVFDFGTPYILFYEKLANSKKQKN